MKQRNSATLAENLSHQLFFYWHLIIHVKILKSLNSCFFKKKTKSENNDMIKMEDLDNEEMVLRSKSLQFSIFKNN